MAIANITNNILTDSGIATSSLLPLSGGTLTGALSGTSATFSSSVTAGSLIVNQASTAADIILKFQINGTNKWLVGLTNDVVDDNFTIYQDGAGGGNRFTINTSGNVGIGTSSPSAILDVRKATASGDTQFNFANSQNSSSGNTSITSSIYLGFYDDSNGLANANKIVSGKTGDYTSAPNANSFLAFHTTNANTTAEKMRITSGGNVGIGNTGESFIKLRITGISNTSSDYSISCVSANGTDTMWVRNDGAGYLKASAWAYGSDRRIKENINYIQTGLDKILALKPATFDYIDGVKNNIGWIAQDVQEVIPEAVNTISDINDQLTLKSDYIVPYLVKAIQEMNTKLDEQNQTIQNLQEQNQDLKSRLDKAGL